MAKSLYQRARSVPWLAPHLRDLRRLRRIFRFRFQLALAKKGFLPEGALPNALCIGVQRAATTWLYSQLKSHPDIFLPSGKELHFFDERYHVDVREEHFRHFIKADFWRQEIDLSDPVYWRWYCYQFRGAGDRVKLDITPDYCRVSPARIRLIRDSLPEVKVLLIVRNPIERAWSSAGNFLHRFQGRTLSDLDLERELLPWVLQPRRLDFGNYIDILTCWESVFPESDRFLVCFYDDVVEQPDSTLSDICRFFGADPGNLFCTIQGREKVNSDYRKSAMPDEVRRRLIEIYQPQIEFLENRFGRDLSGWVK